MSEDILYMALIHRRSMRRNLAAGNLKGAFKDAGYLVELQLELVRLGDERSTPLSLVQLFN